MTEQKIRSKKLLYGQDDRLPIRAIFAPALQYFMTATSFLLLTAIVISAAHLSDSMAADMMSLAMIIAALSAIFQSIKSRFFGAGAFATATPNPAFLGASLLAVQTRGVGLLAGMTIFGSLVQFVLSYALKYLKRFFPPELGALLVCMIGFELGALGIDKFTHLNLSHASGSWQLGVGFAALFLMFTLKIWSKGGLKIFAMLISIVLAYLVLFVMGMVSPNHLHVIENAPWFYMPTWPAIHYTFSLSLVIPFVITAVICVIKVMGSITAIQQVQVENWNGADLNQIRKAGYADALTNVFAGLAGVLGFNISSSMTAVSASTRICSRFVAYPYALMFLFIAICPKVSMVFVYIPQAIIGAILIFLATNLLMTGFKVLSPLMSDPKKQMLVGLSFMLGMSYSIYPFYYQHLPHVFQAFTGSSLAIATIFAFVFNFLLMLKVEN